MQYQFEVAYISVCSPKLSPSLNVASFPGPARSSLAVRNLRRFCTASNERAGPGNEAIA